MAEGNGYPVGAAPTVLGDDDPLASLPDLLEAPTTMAEARRRIHLGEIIADAIDPVSDRDTRMNAIRHILACDPARGVAALTELLGQALATLEQIHEAKPGTGASEIRRDLAAARADLMGRADRV